VRVVSRGQTSCCACQKHRGGFHPPNDAGLLPIDLELAKSVNNTTPLVGSNVVFTVTVNNNKPLRASALPRA
jgi:hypothetical protein